MVKRIGANGRKKKGARHEAVKKTVSLRVPLVIVAIAAIIAAGYVAIDRYGNLMPKLSLPVEMFKTAMAQKVVILGAVQVKPEELVRRCGITFPVTLDQFKKVQLVALQKASPWINDMKILSIHDGTILLGISERKPVAMLLSNGGQGAVCLVDAEGVCLPLGAKAAYALPLVSGLEDYIGIDHMKRLTAGSTMRLNNFFQGAATGGDSLFSKKITQINFSRAGAQVVRIMIEGSPTVIALNEGDINGCLEKYASLRESMENDSLQPARIDLAYRNLAFVTPASVPQQTVAGEATAKKNKG